MKEILLTSPASSAAVLDAIRQEVREWRESVIPPTLRSQGVVQVEGTIRGARFELRYAGSDEALPDVVLRGAVVARPEGGCEVVATLARSAGVFALPALIALLGVWDLVRGDGIGVLAFAGLVTVACVAYTETLSRRAMRDGAYLVDRLRQAVGRAGHGEPVALSNREHR